MEYIAFVTDTDPLKVRLQYEDDDVRVSESVIKDDELSVDDRVLVTTSRRRVTIVGRYGGTSGGGGGHSDDTVDPEDELTGVSAESSGRSLQLSWDAMDEVDAGHGYYEIEISQESDYSDIESRWSGKATKAEFDNLDIATDYYWRVRGVGSDGVAGDWSEGSTLVSGVLGDDIADRAIDLIHLEDEAIGDGRVFAEDVIEGQFIKGRTISARNLLIGNFDNLIQNPNFQLGLDSHHVLSTAGGSWGWATSSDARSGGRVAVYSPPSGGSDSTAELHLNGDATDPDAGHPSVSEGDTFHGRIYVSADSGARPTDFELRISFYDEDGNFIEDGADERLTISSSGWKFVSTTSDPAPSGASYVVMRLRITSVDDTGRVDFDAAHLRERITGELIVDGSVSADKLAAGTIAVGEEIKSAATDSNGEPYWSIDGDGEATFRDVTVLGGEVTVGDDTDWVSLTDGIGSVQVFRSGTEVGRLRTFTNEVGYDSVGLQSMPEDSSTEPAYVSFTTDGRAYLMGDQYVYIGIHGDGADIYINSDLVQLRKEVWAWETVGFGTDGYPGNVDSSLADGAQITEDGRIAVGRAGTPVILNRIGSNGHMILFRRDGSTVGAIRAEASDILVLQSARIFTEEDLWVEKDFVVEGDVYLGWGSGGGTLVRNDKDGVRMRISSTGSASLPAYHFGLWRDTGMYAHNGNGGELRFVSRGNIGMRIETNGDVIFPNAIDVKGSKNARIDDPDDDTKAYRFSAVEFDNPGTLGTIFPGIEITSSGQTVRIPVPEHFSRIGRDPLVIAAPAEEPKSNTPVSAWGYVTGWDDGDPEIELRGPEGVYNVMLLFVRDDLDVEWDHVIDVDPDDEDDDNDDGEDDDKGAPAPRPENEGDEE